MLVEPALTRFKASHPDDALALIWRSGVAVLVQVSRGRELALKPGLNMDGGMQPRGPRGPFMLDMSVLVLMLMFGIVMVDMPILFDVVMLPISIVLDMSDMLIVSDSIVRDESVMLDMPVICRL